MEQWLRLRRAGRERHGTRWNGWLENEQEKQRRKRVWGMAYDRGRGTGEGETKEIRDGMGENG